MFDTLLVQKALEMEMSSTFNSNEELVRLQECCISGQFFLPEIHEK